MPIYKIFEGLSESEVARICDLGVIRPFNPGEVIFRKGDPGNEMYLILTGKVVIADSLGKNMDVVAKLGAGEVLGEMAISGKPSKRSAHAVAREPSQLLVLSANSMLELLETEIPKRFLINIIDLLCRRLRIMNDMYMQAKFLARGPESAKR
jgi:CRP-like cAMP-binding protein